MNKTTYFQNVQGLKKDIYSTRFDEVKDMGLLGTYLLLSANISTYLPEISNDEHYKIIQNIQFHRALSNIDQYYHNLLLENLKVSDKSNILERSNKLGHIFVTYHTGSYRMFIQYLIQKNISFCLVTQEEYIEEQGEIAQQIFKEIRKYKNKNLEILPAENPRLIFELMKRLREGISVVFYIDGNTGVSEKKLNENSNLLKINFLNHHIYARQGIAFLAYLSKSPMAIAIAKRDENLVNTIKINPVNTIELIKKYNRNDFINIITQKLYGELECFLKNNFEQWEGWFYIQKFFEYETPLENLTSKEEVNIKFTKFVTLVIEQSMHLIKYDNEHVFLVTKKDFKIMKITKFLFDVLSFFKKPQTIASKKSLTIDDQEVNWNIVTELIEMNYLKPI